jgi:hypothetical protein
MGCLCMVYCEMIVEIVWKLVKRDKNDKKNIYFIIKSDYFMFY